MKRGFYRRLALTGIYKNKKNYLPYILTCIGMVMMYYIIRFLADSPKVAGVRGGEIMQMVLGLGGWVIGIFAVIFLFYTNSFLIRRRKKEFGLYNILGMGKKNLFQVLLWENVIIAGIALAAGLFCGILFSKLAELCMVKVLGVEGSMDFYISMESIRGSAVLFAVIFLILLLNGTRQIYKANPVELLGSESAGEKPPKARLLLALAGLALVAGAYYLAVTIQDPIAAMLLFFVAVIMVILGTYLLFITGSVAFCRLLQKRKKYYYKTSHFVSVSSMAFRMKRNGAGLASICILSTMVLVMLSSTTCLFIGTEDMLRERYPRDIVVETVSSDPEEYGRSNGMVSEVLASHGLVGENTTEYRYMYLAGYLFDDQLVLDRNQLESFNMAGDNNLRELYVLPLEDYNRMMGTQYSLAPQELLLFCKKTSYTYDTLSIKDYGTFTVKEQPKEGRPAMGSAMASILGSMFLVVPSMDEVNEIYEFAKEIYGEEYYSVRCWYGVDLSCSGEEMQKIAEEISARHDDLKLNQGFAPKIKLECIARDRVEFYATYGGLFFLGVLLGLVFTIAAVLIIYYKQVSEGYEDQKRFAIMQKVGMTDREIRKSINSQVLTVFFLPLILAGIHMAFAFPMLRLVMLIIGLVNTWLAVVTAVVSYLVFAVLYVLVYRGTSRTYYGIVRNH
ncbi:MAG: FtsX-like permease family protein [Lachnospiraceae bacterium]|nr:FtsX-like permease family protein [Lachnospiraceae bacterium]